MDDQRNPYVDSSGVPKLKLSVVAFIDILGYLDIAKENLQAKSSQKLLEKLHKALKISREHVAPEESDDKLKVMYKKDPFAIRAFTDNIVIGHPIFRDAEAELCNTFSDLSYFQMLMTMEGFFIRGAIAVGDHYMDSIAVFGEGLMEAYEAEVSQARDPRIILTKSAKETVNRHLKYYGEGQHQAPQVRDLLKDSDGQYFVNYLDTIMPDDDYCCIQELKNHKEIIEKNYLNIATNQRYGVNICGQQIIIIIFVNENPRLTIRF